MSEGSLVRRDVVRSVLLGPFRFIIPLVGYILTYRIIVQRAGLEIMGVWGLGAAVSSYLALIDVGFSQILAREAGHDISDRNARALELDRLSALRAYGFLAVVAGVGVILLGPVIFGGQSVYSPSGLTVMAFFLVVGTLLTLSVNLDAALLAGLHDHGFIHATAALTPIVTYAIAIGGAWSGYPLEGYAFGSALAAIVHSAILGARLRKRHGWLTSHESLGWRQTIQRISSLARRGQHLYTMSLGFLAREPIFRILLGALTGLASVAVFDAAMRLTRTAREFLAAGFTALYPSLSFFAWTEKRDHTVKLLRISLVALLTIGALILGTIMLLSPQAFSFWIGSRDPTFSSAARILAFWNLLTLANVPFWYLLQATGMERFGAAAIWLHSGLILLLWPIAAAVHLELVPLLWYWLVTSILTQALIYQAVQRRLGLLRVVLEHSDVRRAVGAIVALLLATFVGPAVLWDALGEGWIPPPGYILATLGLYVVAIMPVVLSVVRSAFFAPLFGESKNGWAD